jgi:hypothetical protein
MNKVHVSLPPLEKEKRHGEERAKKSPPNAIDDL